MENCKTAREFGDIFRHEVRKRGSGWDWERDMKPWLAEAFQGAKFGDPACDWTPAAAEGLAREFISDASRW